MNISKTEMFLRIAKITYIGSSHILQVLVIFTCLVTTALSGYLDDRRGFSGLHDF